ncbi:MAG: DUF374 domain-containing protein [bacterium]
MSKKGFIKNICISIKKNKKLHVLLQYTLYLLIKILFMTYRIKISYDDFYKNKSINDQQGVFYFWHQNIISGMFFFYKIKGQGYCIVSPSKDGKIAGFICSRLGFNVLYGSSTKSPIKLIKDSLKILNQTKQICVVGDGSRGPAFKLQRGVNYLAHKNNIPLVFIQCHPSKAITFKKSWDQFKLPLPFTTIHITVHKPEYVPKFTAQEK